MKLIQLIEKRTNQELYFNPDAIALVNAASAETTTVHLRHLDIHTGNLMVYEVRGRIEDVVLHVNTYSR